MSPSDVARLVEIRAKLRARTGNPIFRSNIEALKAEIARLEALNDAS